MKRKNSALHGDLFLIRHILILREQLTPFETNLQSTTKHLDFTPTTRVLASFSTRSLLRFDSANGLVQLAIHGLPGIHDTLVDTKKEIDSMLKMSCLGMKQSAIKMILGPIESFLAKVTAFVGEIPAFTKGTSESSTLTSDAVKNLQGQSFMKVDRVKEMLKSALDTVMISAPDLKQAMQLYIENSVARGILIKPVIHEIDAAKRKLVRYIVNMITLLPKPMHPGFHIQELYGECSKSARV